MRKILVLSIAFILLFSFAGCQSLGAGSDKSGNDNLEGSLEDILAQIFETAQLDDQFRDYVENGLFQTEITVENSSNYFNTEGIEFEAGLASEPMMQPSAYLLTLIRVKEGADVDKIKADIKDNADPMRWICVGVDPSSIYVDNVGDVIMLVMSDQAGEALHEAFMALGK